MPCPSLAQPGAGMLTRGMAALRLAMAPGEPSASVRVESAERGHDQKLYVMPVKKKVRVVRSLKADPGKCTP